MVSGYRMRAILRDHYGMNVYGGSPGLAEKMQELKKACRKGGVSAMMKQVRQDTQLEPDVPELPRQDRQITIMEAM